MISDSKETFNQIDIRNENEFLRTLFRFERIKRNVCLPAIVTDVDDEKHTVDVLVLCNYVTPDGKEIKRAKLVDVPWMQMRHGGFFIDFPIDIGDTGWVFAADRENASIRENNSEEDSSNNKGPSIPEIRSIGEFQFGVFIPDSWCKQQEISKNKLAIGTRNNGKTRAHLAITKDGKVEVVGDKASIKADSDIDGELSIAKSVKVGLDAEISGTAYISRNLYVDGKVFVNGKAISDDSSKDPSEPSEPTEPTGDLQVDNNLTVGGTAQIGSNTTIGVDMEVTGKITATGRIYANGDIVISDVSKIIVGNRRLKTVSISGNRVLATGGTLVSGI